MINTTFNSMIISLGREGDASGRKLVSNTVSHLTWWEQSANYALQTQFDVILM